MITVIMKKNTKKILTGVVFLSVSMIWAQQIPSTNEEFPISGNLKSEPESVSEILYQELLLAKALDVAEAAVTNALNSGLSYESTKEIVLLVMKKNSLLTELSILEESSLLSVVETSGPASEIAVDQTSAVETEVDEAASAKAAVVETAVDQTTTVETAGSETSESQNTADKASPLTVDTTTNELLDEGFVETNFESLRSSAISVNILTPLLPIEYNSSPNELTEILVGGSITSTGNGFIPTGDGSVSNTGDTYN